MSLNSFNAYPVALGWPIVPSGRVCAPWSFAEGDCPGVGPLFSTRVGTLFVLWFVVVLATAATAGQIVITKGGRDPDQRTALRPTHWRINRFEESPEAIAERRVDVRPQYFSNGSFGTKRVGVSRHLWWLRCRLCLAPLVISSKIC